jgi:BCD family chlorophyll transporter-like MFS transporter
LIEIVLLFMTLAAIGPLAGRAGKQRQPASNRFGLAEFPG